MTYDEMTTLVGFLRSAFPSLNQEKLDFYSEMLISEDAQDASTAILEGVSIWHYPPSWAEIKEAIRAVRRRRPRTSEEEVADAVEDASIPDWVRRWLYARFIADPPDMRPFPEQHGEFFLRGAEPELGWMPEDAYLKEAEQVSPAMVRAAISSSKVLAP